MATESDKVSNGALGTLIAVGLFATLSIMLAVTALVRYSARTLADSRADLAAQGYRDLRKEQTEKLSATPAWTDKGQGKVSMPIERAKAKVLSELARDPSSATPPAPAQPAASGETAALAPGAAAPAGEKPAAPAPTVASAKPAAPSPATPPAPAAPKPTDG